MCVSSVLMRACDGQRDWRLVNGFFKQFGCYFVLFSFYDRNAATGTTTFQYILTCDHIPVDTAHRPQINPISFVFTLKPLMVRFHIRVYEGVRHSFGSVYLCCGSTVLTEFISQIKHVLQQADVFPPNISMLEMLEHFDHGDFARRVLFY